MSAVAGRVAIVTGASGALGASIVAELASRGHRVVGVYRSGEASAMALRDRLGDDRVAIVRADLADRAAPAEIRRAAIEVFGPPTILVNNAGAMASSPVEEMSDEEWDRILDLDLSAVFRMTRAVISDMRGEGFGRIISISSQAAYRGSVGRSHYAAAKAGLLGFTFSLAREVGPAGLTANVVVPGRIESEMLSALEGNSRAEWIASTPLGRVGSPGDVAAAVGYLSSPEAGYVTGATLQVGGGLVMG